MAAIVAVGFWLRIQGLSYGLPAVYNMDEVAIMNRALTFATGTLNPGNFLYPTFYFYALFAWQGLTALVGVALGWWDSLAGFERQFFVDPTPLFVSGRLLSALFGTATLLVVYRIGARLRNETTGVIAAALLAVAPFAVQDAHYVKHDVPVTLLIMLVPLALLSSSSRRLWWAGAAVGLATSTHYYAALTALMVIAERLTAPESWPDRVRGLLLAGGIALLVFLAGSPFLIPEWQTAWIDITQNRAIVMDRATTSAGAFGFLGTYLGWLFGGAALGTRVTMVLSVVGMVAGRIPWRSVVMLAVFELAFLLFISNTVPATRYLNPVLPVVALFAAALIGRAAEGRAWAPVLLTLVLVLPAGWSSHQLGRFFEQNDTRTLAQQWIEANVEAGATVLVQPYSVPLHRTRAALGEALERSFPSLQDVPPRFERELRFAGADSAAYRLIYLGDGGLDVDKIYVSPVAVEAADSLEPLRTLGVRWVVMKRYNEPNPSLASFDRALAREGRLITMFSPYHAESGQDGRTTVAPFEHNEDALRHPALERPGPVIELWRID